MNKNISSFIKDNEKHDLTWDLIENLFYLLKEDINVGFDNNFYMHNTAKYVPSENMVYINDIFMMDYLERNINSYSKNMTIDDCKHSPIYFLAQCLLHEISHAKQYLMGERKINVIDDFLADSYKELYKMIIDKNYNIDAYKLYLKDENFYLLERNAQVESMMQICNICMDNNRESLQEVFKNIYDLYLMCGYIDNKYGSIYETFNQIGLMDIYNKLYKNSSLDEKSRILYGLLISEKSRKKVLKY